MKKTKVKASSTTTSPSNSLLGRTFKVHADNHGGIKYQGHINAEVAPGIFLVEVDDKLHLVPLTSMVAGSLEAGPGTWEFE